MNKAINLLLIITFLGYALSNTITLPLIESKTDGLVVNIKCGTQECQKIMRVQAYDGCTTQIKNDPEHDNCGATKLDYNRSYQGYNYNAQFLIDTTSFSMNFTIPDVSYDNYNQNIFCLSPSTSIDDMTNPVVVLYKQGFIKNQHFYFYAKNITYMSLIDTVVGALHIGQPDMSVVKPGSKVYQLLSYNNNFKYSIQGSKRFRYDGESITFYMTFLQLSYPYSVSQTSHCITIDTVTLERLIMVFRKKGLKFTQKDYVIHFQSLQGLGNFEFDLYAVGDKSFTVTFTPQEMTTKQSDGTYYLRMCEDPTIQSAIFGYSIFNRYYVGYNLDNNSQLIAERADQQVQQF
ncbi:hypothetical protein ABPG74_007512 [Tetrahymena malaccensis]